MRPLRVAIVKPDWRIRGGFELVLDRVIDHLRARGDDVRLLGFDAWAADRRPFGQRVDDEVRRRAPQFFTYLAHVEACRRLRVGGADLLISTQPPSFVTPHRHHLALFYHHQRMFYDLSEHYLAAGLIEDADTHRAAVTAVRQIDDDALARVPHILSGSETVSARLLRFHQRTRGVSLFHAGPTVEATAPARATRRFALCISRHDFPKRTELFVHAMHLLGGVRGVAVGAGGRLGALRALDRSFATEGAPEDIPADELWLTASPWIDPADLVPGDGPVQFLTDVTALGMQHLLGTAACLVAPALLEDYGLTAIEAMQHGVPVITCRDSGHLVEFVEDGVSGFVVEPTGRAIADAVRCLVDDPDRRAEMSAAARERAAEYTWCRALDELDAGIDEALA